MTVRATMFSRLALGCVFGVGALYLANVAISEGATGLGAICILGAALLSGLAARSLSARVELQSNRIVAHGLLRSRSASRPEVSSFALRVLLNGATVLVARMRNGSSFDLPWVLLDGRTSRAEALLETVESWRRAAR